MKSVLLSILFLNISTAVAQTHVPTSTPAKTEILKGSQQQMMSECGSGKTAIKQTVITTSSTNGKKVVYKIKTILWFQFADAEGKNCYGAWGYDLLALNEEKLTLPDVEKEKKRQAEKAFGLLNYLQLEGNH